MMICGHAEKISGVRADTAPARKGKACATLVILEVGGFESGGGQRGRVSQEFK
jgi:hypothetical protein